MNIPDEAVEAAARAAYEVKPTELFGRAHPITWEQLSDSPLGQRGRDRLLRRIGRNPTRRQEPTLRTGTTRTGVDGMTIKQAIEQIDNRTQEIPSNWHAGKGLSDGVTWSEVREWLASLTATENATLAGVWQSAYSYGVDDERTSQANPGIAGCFCNTSPCRCFIDPARVNPYRPTQ